jgi:hypothetical protein
VEVATKKAMLIAMLQKRVSLNTSIVAGLKEQMEDRRVMTVAGGTCAGSTVDAAGGTCAGSLVAAATADSAAASEAALASMPAGGVPGELSGECAASTSFVCWAADLVLASGEIWYNESDGTKLAAESEPGIMNGLIGVDRALEAGFV